MKVIVSPYHRSVTIDGVEVRQKMLEFPNALNHLASISCTYDKNSNTVTELSDVHRYVSHFTEREYFNKHLPEFIEWYYAEKQAQIDEEARLQKYKEDVENAISQTVQAGEEARTAIANDKTEALNRIDDKKFEAINNIRNVGVEVLEVSQNSLNAINSARTNAVSEIYNLKTESVTTINQLKADSVNEITYIKETALTSINNKQQEAEASIGIHKTAAQSAVDATGKINKDTLDDIGTNYLNQTKEQVELAKEQVTVAKEAADRAVAISNVGPATRSKLGLVKIGRGLEVDEEGLIEVRSSVTMLAPIVEAPDTLSLGYNNVFTMQAYPGLGRTSIKQYRCTLENVGTQIIDADEETGAGTVTFVVPRAIGPNKSLKLTVIALDTLNNESLPTELTRSTVQAFVNAPNIISPEESSTIRLLQGFTATSSSFETTALSDTHESTDWVIAKDINADVIVVELNGTSDLYSHTFTRDELVGKILPNQSYYVFARYNGALLGTSALGMGRQINIVADVILPPNISSPEDYTVIYPTAGFVAEIDNDFETDGITDTHTSTDWFITTDKAGNNIIASCMNSSDLKIHKFTPTELYNLQNQEQMYYVHARFHGRLIESSAKSAAVVIVSKEALIEAPILDQVNFTPVYPTGGIELSTSSVFVSRGITSDTHKSTDWFIYYDEAGERIVAQAKNSSDLYSHVFPVNVLTNMEIGKVYYVAARFNGEQIETGKLSQIVSVVTRGAYIHAPEISSPSNNEEIYKAAGLTVTTSSTFRTTGAADRHISTDWLISRDIDGLDVVVSAINSPDLKQHTFTAEDLADLKIDSYYYVSIRFNGEVITKGTTSEVVKVVVRPAFITAPVIDNPAENSDVYKTAGITVSTSSNFIPVGITDNHISTDWLIASDNLCKNILVSDLKSTDLKTHTFNKNSLTELQNDTTYYVFCRFNGRIVKTGNLSSPLPVVNRGAYIEAPIISSPDSNNKVLVYGVDLTFSTLSFRPIGIEDTHIATDWIIAEDIDGQNIVLSSLNNTTDLYSHTFTKSEMLAVLQKNKTYYIFARHIGRILNASSNSIPVSFIAVPTTIITPNLYFADDNTNLYYLAGVTLKSSSFGYIGVEDTHIATDWIITKDTKGEEVVAESLRSSNLLNHTFSPEELTEIEDNTYYYAWVRHISQNTGASKLAGPYTMLSVRGYIDTPSITNKDSNTVYSLQSNDDLSITTSAFTPLYTTDSFDSLIVGIFDTADSSVPVQTISFNDAISSNTWTITNNTFSSLEKNTLYFIRVKYKGKTLGDSNWSNPIKFLCFEWSDTLKSLGTVRTDGSILITSSKTFTTPIDTAVTYQLSIVGGGGKNGSKGSDFSCNSYVYGGAGGTGGAGETKSNIILSNNTEYTLTIGGVNGASSLKQNTTVVATARAGGAGSNGGNAGGNGYYCDWGGCGYNNCYNGSRGSNGTTYGSNQTTSKFGISPYGNTANAGAALLTIIKNS